MGDRYVLGCLPGYCADRGEIEVTCSEEIARYGYDDDENLVTCRQVQKEEGMMTGVSCLHDEHTKLGFKLSSSLIFEARRKVSVRLNTPLDPKATEERFPLEVGEFTAMVDCNVCLDQICDKLFDQHDSMIQKITSYSYKWVGCAVNRETRVGACEYRFMN